MNETVKSLLTAATILLPSAVRELDSAQTAKVQDADKHIEEAKRLIRQVLDLADKTQQSRD